MCINNNNNAVINNNLWKTTRPYFALENFHENAKGCLPSLWNIRARALRKVRLPWRSITHKHTLYTAYRRIKKC